MFQLTIPSPCHEDWSKMTPDKNGRFCSSCAKIVVDFTQMNDDEVKNYFLLHATQKTCGRFLSAQLNRPLENQAVTINAFWYSTLPLARQVFYAVALFFVLGASSCELSNNESQQKQANLHPPMTEQAIFFSDPDSLGYKITPPPVIRKRNSQPVLTGDVVSEPMPPEVTQGAPLWVDPPDTLQITQHKLKKPKMDSLINVTEPVIMGGIPIREEIKPDSVNKK